MSQTRTVTETLTLMKSVKGRLEDLKTLRNLVAVQVAAKGSYDPKTLTGQEYVNPEVTITDAKITELEYFLSRAETAIDFSNRVTEIELDFDIDRLLKPLGEKDVDDNAEQP